MNKSFHQRARGFTLMELMLSLVVVTTIIGYSLTVFGRVRAEVQGQKAINQIYLTQSAIRGIFQKPKYSGLGASLLIKSGRIPDQMINSARNGLIDPWGQAILFSPVSVNGGFVNAYNIIMLGMPASECNTVVTAVNADFFEISIGGIDVKNDYTSPPVRYDPASAVAACNARNNAVNLIGH